MILQPSKYDQLVLVLIALPFRYLFYWLVTLVMPYHNKDRTHHNRDRTSHLLQYFLPPSSTTTRYLIKSGSQIMEENMEAVFNRMMIRHMHKPGMTDKEWSNAKRLAREETRQICSDSNLTIRGTANRLIQDRIEKIPCDCKTEEMRAGKFCKTCRLLAKVNDYMLSLLKEASED